MSNKIKYFFIVLFSILFHNSTFSHPLHLSVTTVDISSSEIIVCIKVFEDDFQKALINKQSDIDYIKDHLTLRINNNQAKLSFTKKKTEDVSSWYYFTIKNTAPVISISGENTLLLNIYDDQTNLVIINNNKSSEGFNLNFKKRSFTFE